MMNEIKLEDYKTFDGLTFKEKLKYWDQNGIYFENQFVVLEDDISICLAISNLEDLVLYNKWVVEHYIKELQQGIFDFYPGIAPLGSRYKSFEEYVRCYNLDTNNRNLLDKQLFIKSQIEMLGEFLKKRSIERDVLKIVSNSISTDNEYDLYTTQQPLRILKEIAKSIDLVRYFVFLRHERIKLENTKVTEVKYDIEVNIEIITNCYYELKSNHFIHPETKLENFLDVFIRDDSSSGKIKWIDDKYSNNKVRVLTLLLFIQPFIRDHKLQSKFIQKHFQINRLNKYGIERELISEDIKPRSIVDARDSLGTSNRTIFIENLIGPLFERTPTPTI